MLDSTVVTNLNVCGVETLIADDGKTYGFPLKVNLNQCRSRDKDGVVVNFDDASVPKKLYSEILWRCVENKRQALYTIPCRVW